MESHLNCLCDLCGETMLKKFYVNLVIGKRSLIQ